ncbi:Uncharacterized conserved protein, DUF2141 family [Cribrihabitans marinus]|uniref:Uncharacterized conserved protein, DUF2141 family n=1 Tax=Cribrihabitans marinus TaxID=1227549 RepID=A0A1H7E0F3_9RHOB|nr:DUF2141 domain-containing protein [Cribrihabitans marinus]GGH41396.1 hypothetical protein GCM10010973_38300 [Cribrihabitans marinus]SEK07473.1 Uncharacterized conserved protein, DUF2141 family [Cribrihabitans marinus]
MQSAIKTLLLAASLASTEAAAGQIDLTMTGFASDKGMARIVLVEGIEGYTGGKPVTLTATVPIDNGTARWTADVPRGTYSMIAHHDRDENGELDRPLFQLPLEPYGFSNGAWTSAGLPAFDEVAFEVGDGTARQRIRMRMNAFATLLQVVPVGAVALAALFTILTIRRRRAVRHA